jgi:glucosamine-6-phosphate deaminase
MSQPLCQFRSDAATVLVFANKADLAQAAALAARQRLCAALDRRGEARIIVATGPSQHEFVACLAALPGIEWKRIEVFHMDEYLGVSASHTASFRRWLREHLAELVHPGAVHYLAGDAPDVEAECERYARLLAAGPMDISFVGFGENGHIAFNDPGAADFNDPRLIKKVELAARSRLQQVGEGHFPTLEAVPREALTLTCPALLRAEHLLCCVPDRRKAEAVKNALEGPLTPDCPASLVRTHAGAWIFLDEASASALGGLPMAGRKAPPRP